MRVDSMLLRAAMAVSMAGIMGCGMLGGLAPEPSEKDFITEARAAVDEVKAEITLLLGIATVVQQKVEELLYFEEGLKLGRVKWKKFRTQLTDCWSAPAEAVADAKKRAVSAVDAAKQFKNRSTLHEVKAVQDTAWNAVNTVKRCPQALSDQVLGFPKRAKDEVKEWAQGKLEIINDIRVLLKEEVPARVKGSLAIVTSAPATVAKQLASAEAYKATLEKLKSTKTLKKHNQQLKQLEALKTEITTLGGDLQKQGTQVTAQATKMTKDVVEGLSSFGKKK